MSINEFEYVEPASRMQLADKLSHLCSYSPFMIFLLGNEGSGRTTLLDQLEELHEPRTQRLARIELSDKTDVSRLLVALVDALQLEVELLTDNRLRLAAIHKQIRALADVNIALHLHIDNADHLTDNGLELLLSLLQLGEIAPHLLLVALPAFEQRAAEKGVLDRFENRIHIQRLEPFEDEEIEDFILSLLPPHVELTPKQLKKLVELCDGYPGGIITSVDTLLRQGGGKSAMKGLPIPPLHLAAVIGVLFVITGFAVWHYLPSTESEQELTDRIQVIPEPIAVNTAEPVVEIEVRETLAQRLAEQEARIEEEPLTIPTLDIEAEQVAEVEAPEVVVEEPVTAPAPTPATEPGTLAQAPQVVSPAPTTTSAITPQQPVVAQAQTQTQSPAPAVAATPAVAPATTTAPIQAPPPAPTPTPQRSEAPPAVVNQTVAQAPSAAASNSGNHAQILLGWPDNGFTLQVLGARSEESVIRFIQSQAQPQRFYRFVTIHQGAPWHVVVYGQYPTRQAATEAVRSLPAELRDRNPWARTISSVKEDIRKIDQ